MAVTNEDMNKDKNNVSTETTKKINMAEIFSKTLDDEMHRRLRWQIF